MAGWENRFYFFCRLFPLAVLAALAGSLQVLASAAEVRIGAGGRLEPGQEVAVCWSALPPETEEFELLLKCESPFVLKVRLTDCKDPRSSGLTWVVPCIPCERARLLVRRGVGGREIDWAWSRPFSIKGGLSGKIQRVAYYGGELWATDEVVACLWDGRSGELGRGAAQGDRHRFCAPSDDTLQPVATVRSRGFSHIAGVLGGRSLTVTGRAPMTLALRI